MSDDWLELSAYSKLMNCPKRLTVETVSREGMKVFREVLNNPKSLLVFGISHSEESRQEKVNFLFALLHTELGGKGLLGLALSTPGFIQQLVQISSLHRGYKKDEDREGIFAANIMILIRAVDPVYQVECLVPKTVCYLKGYGQGEALGYLQRELARHMAGPIPNTGQRVSELNA